MSGPANEKAQTIKTFLDSTVIANLRINSVKRRVLYVHKLLRKIHPAPCSGFFLLVTKQQKPDYWFLLNKNLIDIGRDENSDICLASEKVSRHHCVIEASKGDWVVKDTGSTNGLFVNSKITGKHILREGDLIAIGEFELLFIKNSDLKD